jgi:predicted GIY-YIG superfamily endonuclease
MLRYRDGSLYVGMTNDIAGRVEKHNRGLGPEFTKRRRPVELIWSQEFSDRFAVREREVELKGWSRKKKLSLIAGLEKSEGNPRATTQGNPFAGATGSRSG